MELRPLLLTSLGSAPAKRGSRVTVEPFATHQKRLLHAAIAFVRTFFSTDNLHRFIDWTLVMTAFPNVNLRHLKREYLSTKAQIHIDKTAETCIEQMTIQGILDGKLAKPHDKNAMKFNVKPYAEFLILNNWTSKFAHSKK